MIYRVSVDLLPEVWPAVRLYCDDACSFHPWLESDDVLYQCACGKAQLFVATDGDGLQGFLAVEVVSYATKRVAHVLAAGGRRGFLKVASTELLAELESFANEFEADILAVTGRPGWKRFTQRVKGQAMEYSIVWKELKDVRRRRHSNDSSEKRSVGASSALSH